MKTLLPLLAALLVFTVPARAEDWQADPADKLQVAVQDTVDAFVAANPELEEYFEQATGYAVFPRIVKVGAMWGGAYGKGLMIENGRLVGRCSQWLGSLGLQLGAQSYRQLILFRSEEAVGAFKQGRVEFQGRASAVAVRSGKAADPGYLPDVAIFTLANGGLMLEAAAGGVKYHYKPLGDDSR